MQNYGGGGEVTYGIEAVLLDLKNPRNIIGRTKGAFMVAEEYYENAGMVSHLIFPSGAMVRKIGGEDILEVYYGAADTHCAKASISVDNLLKTIIENEKSNVKRFPGNPIIAPRPKVNWEAKGTLNPAAIELDKQVHILYRAVSDKDVSTIGLAVSKDGLSIDERLKKPIYTSRANFEKNGGSDRNFGCEDPRVVKIDNTVYMTYTAYDGHIPRVAISSIHQDDFIKRNWNGWSAPHVITPENVDNKDACIIPGQINGKFILLHRVNEHICGYILNSLDFAKERVNECIDIIGPRRGMWDGAKVGIAAPPIKTSKGWLLLYHGVSPSTTYRVGAVLLDLKDPLTILARSAVPLFEPQEEYEMRGMVPRVVFPCGLVARGDKAFMYYGGADSVVGVATFSIKEVLKRLTN
jgi:beta-1,2-mannobiose phosphorylase / 1,2-beta-oligomannan phosphorylase